MAAQNSAAVTPIVEGNATMLSLNITSWCTPGTVPEKINFVNMPAPSEVKKDEVIISIKAASIQVDDLALLQNTAAGGWFYHTRPPTVEKPVVGGCDYAGTVTKVGPECTKLKVGDRVCGIQKPAEYQAGTWAEFTLAPEKDVCLIEDDNLSFVDAAAVQMGTLVSFDMIVSLILKSVFFVPFTLYTQLLITRTNFFSLSYSFIT